MGALGGLYRPTPQGYIGNLAGRRARLSVSLATGFSAGCCVLPAGLVRSRQAASAAHGFCRPRITVAVMLMTLTWSEERGYSPAAWREITVATPGLISLMACMSRDKGRPPTGGRPLLYPLGRASAFFLGVAAR